MKLVIAVVQRQDTGELLEALTAQGHRVTRISSEGGFLREGNVTLLIAVDDQAVDSLLRTIREHCYTRTRYVSPLPPVAESGEFYPPVPVEVQVGGATIFVLKTDGMFRL
ncbi:MAG: cyclic-di-AMP receptor [Roseiflexaceae bacterium]